MVLLLFVPQKEVLPPRSFLATTHLDSLLIHIPDVLGWDPTREASMKTFQLVKVIIDDSFIEILCVFRVKLRSL